MPLSGYRWSAFAILVVLLYPTDGSAQGARRGPGPTPQESVERAGGKLVPPGQLNIDGRRMTCGRQPTVLDDHLEDASAA